MRFVIADGNDGDLTRLSLNRNGGGNVELVGHDGEKRRVIITLNRDGTFSRNQFANLRGISVSCGNKQILEKQV